ncbi:MAG: hypothetical protein OXT01_04110, partial [Rhodospirillaceae bacterium]|nr:hypothetical protein [Rhodospirillaceae bacterium]
DDLDGTLRRSTLSEATARDLGVSDGDLIELSHRAGAAALRGWVHIDDTGDALKLGPLGIAALGATPGDAIELRALDASVV